MKWYSDAEQREMVQLFVELEAQGIAPSIAEERVGTVYGVSPASLNRYRRKLLGKNPRSRGQYSDDVRQAVVARYEQLLASGLSAGQAENRLTAEMGVSAATIRRFRSGAARERGPRRSGPPPKFTDPQARQLVTWVREAPTATLYDLKMRVKREWDLDVAESTLKRALRAQGIIKRHVARETRASSGEDAPVSVRVGFTDKHRRKAPTHPHRKGYPSDLTDAEWDVLAPLIENHPHAGYTVKYDMRDIVDAVRYQDRTGMQWRYLPNDFPPHDIVFHHWQKWVRNGLFDALNQALNEAVRKKEGRAPTPTAAILDAQSVKTVHASEDVGFDGNKKVNGAQAEHCRGHARTAPGRVHHRSQCTRRQRGVQRSERRILHSVPHDRTHFC